MDILSTILNAIWINGINVSHKNCIKGLIRALLLTFSVNLLKLARIAFPKVKPTSTVRRIERLLALSIFNTTMVGQAIVKALPGQKRYILTMDRTTWELGKRVYNILVIGICFDGISIPFYFSALLKRGATNFSEQIDFIEHVLDIIPASQIECLVADREFGYPNFIKWLESQKIPYCLRIRENSYIRDAADKSSRKAKTVLSSLTADQCVVLKHSYLVNRSLKVRIYAQRRRIHDQHDGLLILATPVNSSFTDKIYRLRWQIETSFRAMKTMGFNMEKTHLPLNGRFQNMLDIILIAYACAFIEGLIKARNSPIPIMKENGRKRFSIYSYGVNLLIPAILHDFINKNLEDERNGT